MRLSRQRWRSAGLCARVCPSGVVQGGETRRGLGQGGKPQAACDTLPSPRDDGVPPIQREDAASQPTVSSVRGSRPVRAAAVAARPKPSLGEHCNAGGSRLPRHSTQIDTQDRLTRHPAGGRPPTGGVPMNAGTTKGGRSAASHRMRTATRSSSPQAGAYPSKWLSRLRAARRGSRRRPVLCNQSSPVGSKHLACTTH